MGKSIPYDEYFDEMNLTKDQKRKRKEFAQKMEKTILFIFSLFMIMREYNRFNEERIIERLKEQYRDVAKDYVDIDRRFELYIDEISRDIIEATINNPNDEYYLSEDRAILISENEANTSLNYQEYSQAIKYGKIYKRWITENDSRVRETHKELHRKVMPIDDTFLVGNSLMLFPKDTSLGASSEEIVNCRCTIEYF